MKKNIILFIILIFAINASAQIDTTKIKYNIDISLIEFPYSVKNSFLSYRNLSPGMQGSLSLTKSFTEMQKYYTFRLFFNPKKNYNWYQKGLRALGFGLVDLTSTYMLSYVPLSSVWLHEEWHSSVMVKYNISSFNDMNTFPFNSTLIAVHDVKDNELAELKKTSNPDFIRLSAAGLEAETELTKALQMDNFYNNLNIPMSFSYLFNVASTSGYLSVSPTSTADSISLSESKKSGTDISKRDFTGLDPLAWIYDLNHPNEVYEERGTHPSGVGIRRYRLTSDLSIEELNYLKKMGRLNLVNLISPTLFFINSIKINNNLRANFSMFHYLTSFGYDIGSNFYVNYKEKNIFLGLHNYHNFKNSFYGVETQLVDYPILFMNKELLITPTIFLWTQPKNQDFKTSSYNFGGKASASISFKLRESIFSYITFSAKTKGWVAGDLYLDNNFNTRIGLRFKIK